jgi:hypothetical protein
MRTAHAAVSVVLFAAVALTGGCGRRGDLQPADGTLPPAPVWTETSPSPAEMLEPPPQAGPLRVDETLKRSERRQEDPFDLPPQE